MKKVKGGSKINGKKKTFKLETVEGINSLKTLRFGRLMRMQRLKWISRCCLG